MSIIGLLTVPCGRTSLAWALQLYIEVNVNLGLECRRSSASGRENERTPWIQQRGLRAVWSLCCATHLKTPI
jgi:hypothetical protein